MNTKMKLWDFAVQRCGMEQYTIGRYWIPQQALVESNVCTRRRALAVVILLLFLRLPRSVLMIRLSIPMSVIATMLFVKIFGRSINVISLAGWLCAVGSVVDNAIVVLENIYRHFQMGK